MSHGRHENSAILVEGNASSRRAAAQKIATELNRDLHRVDLSAVVSKYIGETEKHLRKIFDEAEASGSILFFDEADAVFGKRTDVRDSHDRYANIEVSYLLKRIEEHKGVVILAANNASDVDPDVLRRVRSLKVPRRSP